MVPDGGTNFVKNFSLLLLSHKILVGLVHSLHYTSNLSFLTNGVIVELQYDTSQQLASQMILDYRAVEQLLCLPGLTNNRMWRVQRSLQQLPTR